MWERPVLDGENMKQGWEQRLIVGHQEESHSWINVSDVNRKCKYKQSEVDCEHESEAGLSCIWNVTKNQRWNVYMCRHGKAILLFSLTCSLVVRSHSLPDGTAKQKCTFLAAPLCFLLFVFLSLTPLKSQTLMGPKAPKDRWAIDSPVRLHRSWASTEELQTLCSLQMVSVTGLFLPALLQRWRGW